MIVKMYDENRVIAISSMNKKGYIGKNGDLILKNKEDLQFFKRKTSGHIVIMGRKTFESIGKPLHNRINIVVSKTITKKEAIQKGVYVCKTPLEALTLAYRLTRDFEKHLNYRQDIFIIGGEKIYFSLLDHTDEIILNVFKENEDEGDVKFPEIPKNKFNLKYRKYHKDFVSLNYKSNFLIKET